MATSAIDQITGSGLAASLGLDTVDDWIAHPDRLSALLFAGRAKRRREGHDVAVALRELARQYGGLLRVGVVDDVAEDRLMRRFGVIALPSVVLFVGGEPIERLPRVRDWGDYAAAARRYLGPPPSRTAA